MLTSVVAIYALIMILVPISMYKNPFVIFLMFFFFLYAYNHIALTYIPDGQNDIPDWLSLLVPIVLALASILLLNLARWALALLFVLLVTMLFAQVLIVALAATVALALTLVCFCCIRSCQSAGAFERMEAFVQSIVVSASATTLVVVAVGALYDYFTDSDASGLDRCAGRTNTLLLCDYRCASLTTAGDTITWQGIWAGAVIAITAVRVLFLTMCGYRDWRMLSDRCCSNGSTTSYDNDELTVSAVDETPDIELQEAKRQQRRDSPSPPPRRPLQNQKQKPKQKKTKSTVGDKKKKQHARYDSRDAI